MARFPSSLRVLQTLGVLSLSLASLAGCVSEDDPNDGSDGAGTGASTGTGATSGTGATNGTGGVVGGTGATSGTGASTGTGGAPDKSGPRVVGYLPTWRNMSPELLDLDTLTHICIAFANPTGSGNEVDFDSKQSEVGPLVEAAHAKGVKVLASIAGAAGGEAVRSKLEAGNVDAFVSSLVTFMNSYGLDGIDVDIEGYNVDHTYEPFVKKLSAAIGQDKLLTAAVANWNGDDFSDGALAEYDFINVMSYDHCGTWTDACEHSSPGDTQQDMNYWVNTRGYAADKTVLGVPFYGYCWGSSCPGEAMTYADILSYYPEQSTTDYFSGSGYQVSHNSPATIASKATLAKQYGGVMIWELGQDASGDASLFKIIRDAQ